MKIIDPSTPQSWFTLHSPIWDTLYVIENVVRVLTMVCITHLTASLMSRKKWVYHAQNVLWMNLRSTTWFTCSWAFHHLFFCDKRSIRSKNMALLLFSKVELGKKNTSLKSLLWSKRPRKVVFCTYGTTTTTSGNTITTLVPEYDQLMFILGLFIYLLTKWQN